MRRGAGRARVVQLQPAILHHRAHLHHLRRRDRLHLPGRHGVPALGRAGLRALRLRRDLPLHGHPDARPRLRLGQGRPRVDPRDQGRSARRAERLEPDAARGIVAEPSVAGERPKRPPSRRWLDDRGLRKERTDVVEPEPDGAPEGDGRQVRRRRRQRHHHQRRPGDQLAPQLGPARTASGTCSSASPAAPSS